MAGDWRDRAACRGASDPDLWFPASYDGPGTTEEDEAKAVCWGKCRVRAECLAFALDEGLDHGVFGGLNPEERREYKQRRDRVRAWLQAQRQEAA